jgi:hypothetical protein
VGFILSQKPGSANMTDIYQILDDGRIVELRMGRQLEREHAIWARDLTARERKTYLQLKSKGYSDTTIYNLLNQDVKEEAGASR